MHGCLLCRLCVLGGFGWLEVWVAGMVAGMGRESHDILYWAFPSGMARAEVGTGIFRALCTECPNRIAEVGTSWGVCTCSSQEAFWWVAGAQAGPRLEESQSTPHGMSWQGSWKLQVRLVQVRGAKLWGTKVVQTWNALGCFVPMSPWCDG